MIKSPSPAHKEYQVLERIIVYIIVDNHSVIDLCHTVKDVTKEEADTVVASVQSLWKQARNTTCKLLKQADKVMALPEYKDLLSLLKAVKLAKAAK
jgi:hypothetical protein